MPEYGITLQGPNIKRFDTILGELHADLSERWGVNTRMNPQSFLGYLLATFADKWAELWEFGEHIYHAKYPTSAEGVNLDNALLYSGVTRDEPRPTIYPIHARCVEGAAIGIGSMIRTDTNPPVQLLAAQNVVATRAACNSARVRVAVVEANEIYTVALDGALYSYSAMAQDTAEDIIAGLAQAINDPAFAAEANGGILHIYAASVSRSHNVALSSNLTTDDVTVLVLYETQENGEHAVPNGTINTIVTMVAGLLEVNNLAPYIAGRLIQDDIGARRDYGDRVFILSQGMAESIKAAILQNVQGIQSVAVYQNDSNNVDELGRWPHCVEVVVEGGDEYSIATQIWTEKAHGIQTFGTTEVAIPGDEGEQVVVRFNRPERVYVWYRAEIKISQAANLPPNYVEMITEIVQDEHRRNAPGSPINPQRFIGAIYARVPGIGHLSMLAFATTDNTEQPQGYQSGEIMVTARQYAVTDETRIEVALVA